MQTTNNKMPRYRREYRAMRLLISVQPGIIGVADI